MHLGQFASFHLHPATVQERPLAMPKTLNKTDLIRAIQQENGFSLKRSSEVVESILNILKDTLESGGITKWIHVQ